MAGLVQHVGAMLNCGHGGMVQTVSSNTRVFASGLQVATSADLFTVAGCPVVIAASPMPCLTVQWLVPAVRVFVNGQPVVTSTSVGISQNPAQLPQGAPIPISSQVRVSAQ